MDSNLPQFLRGEAESKAEAEEQEAQPAEDQEQEVQAGSEEQGEAEGEETSPPSVDQRTVDGLRGEISRLRAERRGEWESLRQQILQSVAPAQPEQAKPPSKEDDPIDYLRHAQNEGLSQLRNEFSQYVGQQQQAEQLRSLVQAVHTQQTAFAKEHEDYGEAVDYARNMRVKMYELSGIDPSDARSIVQREELQFAAAHLASGVNPAEAAYRLAQEVGWKPRASNGNVHNKVEKIKQGVAKSKSLGQMSGSGSSSGEITGEDYVKLSADDKFKIANDENLWKTLMTKQRVRVPWQVTFDPDRT